MLGIHACTYVQYVAKIMHSSLHGAHVHDSFKATNMYVYRAVSYI